MHVVLSKLGGALWDRAATGLPALRQRQAGKGQRGQDAPQNVLRTPQAEAMVSGMLEVG